MYDLCCGGLCMPIHTHTIHISLCFSYVCSKHVLHSVSAHDCGVHSSTVDARCVCLCGSATKRLDNEAVTRGYVHHQHHQRHMYSIVLYYAKEKRECIVPTYHAQTQTKSEEKKQTHQNRIGMAMFGRARSRFVLEYVLHSISCTTAATRLLSSQLFPHYELLRAANTAL